MKHTKKNTEENSVSKKLIILKQVSLNDKDRARMDFFIAQYVAMHPVLENRGRVSRERKGWYSERSSFFTRAMPAFVIGVLVVLGSATFAESALPGNPLYGLKTGGEDLRQTFIFNEEKSARFESERISRRLNEAHKLIQKGVVTEGATDRLARELEENLLSLRNSLDSLSAKDQRMVVFGIEKTSGAEINTYREIFLKIAEQEESTGVFLSRIIPHFSLLGNEIKNENQTVATLISTTESDSESPSDPILFLDGLLVEEVVVREEEQEGEVLVPLVALRAYQEGGELVGEPDSELDSAELREYVSARIEETKRLVSRARPTDRRISEVLARKLDATLALYEKGLLAEGMNDEMGLRSYFLESLDAVESLRVLTNISSGKLDDFLISFILAEHEKEEEDGMREVFPTVIIEGVRGGRDGPEPFEVENGNEGGPAQKSESSQEGRGVITPDMDEVRRVLENIRL